MCSGLATFPGRHSDVCSTSRDALIRPCVELGNRLRPNTAYFIQIAIYRVMFRDHTKQPKVRRGRDPELNSPDKCLPRLALFERINFLTLGYTNSTTPSLQSPRHSLYQTPSPKTVFSERGGKIAPDSDAPCATLSLMIPSYTARIVGT